MQDRYARIVNGLRTKTRSGDIDWEKADDPWTTGAGYDASLARSSFQLRLDDSTKKVTLSVIGEEGASIVKLAGGTLDNENDSLVSLYKTVSEREHRLMLQRLDQVIADLDAADEPPF